MKRITALAAFLAIVSIALGADDIPNAQSVLDKLADAESAKPSARSSPLTSLIDAYKQQRATLSPEKSGARWLDLFDAYVEQRGTDANRWQDFGRDMDHHGVRPVLLALPSTEHWPALSAAIKNRPRVDGKGRTSDMALRLLGSVLGSDPAERKAILDELIASAGVTRDEIIERHDIELLRILTGENAEFDAVKVFERELASPQFRLSVPDLVSMVGRARAEALLTDALTKSTVPLSFSRGRATVELAQEVALRRIDQLKVAQWELVNSIDSAELYERMQRRFPIAERDSTLGNALGIHPGQFEDAYGARNAKAYYLASLVNNGRQEEATNVARDVLNDDLYGASEIFRRTLDTPALKSRAYDTLKPLAATEAPKNFWSIFTKLAIELGKTEEASEQLRGILKRDTLPDDERGPLNLELATMELAAGQHEQAIATLRDTLALRHDFASATSAAERLAKLAQALDRPELLAVLVTRLQTQPADSVEAMTANALSQGVVALASALNEVKRPQDAANVLVADMVRAVHSIQESSHDSPYALQALLVELMSTYISADRHADALLLLDSATYWGQSDLAQIWMHRDSSQAPIGYLAAVALSVTGRREEARTLVDALVETNSGYDPAYTLLISLTDDRQAVLNRLDALIARDPFEERPLIWKAELLRRGGQLDEAEACARKAISIDPSDGEQPRGDRMRVYAVLAAILGDKGNLADANIFRNVVQAIRTAEQADKLAEAGLLQSAIEQYHRSLTFFQDAYCIQSRLAIQLAEAGDFAAAERHYRRAYELMPSSFGRVESHCFGCEGAFRGAFAQQLAENVFARLAAENPQNPQIHYLRGYLMIQQGRPSEALAPLREAVRLDPDYLNAWKTIADLQVEAVVSADEIEAANLALIRLDPRQRHARADLRQIRNLAKLWQVVETAAPKRVSVPSSLYPLKASARALETKNERDRSSYGGFEANEIHLRSPAHALLETSAFQVILRMMEDF